MRQSAIIDSLQHVIALRESTDIVFMSLIFGITLLYLLLAIIKNGRRK